MTLPHSSHEALILSTLQSGDALTMEQVKARLPQLNWWEVLHAVDVLSRRGEIILRRKGFDYELQVGAPSRRGESSIHPT
jgi:hypothetical protein